MSLEPSRQNAIGRGVQYEYYMVPMPSNFGAQQGKIYAAARITGEPEAVSSWPPSMRGVQR